LDLIHHKVLLAKYWIEDFNTRGIFRKLYIEFIYK
jgi:hypothetical protein